MTVASPSRTVAVTADDTTQPPAAGSGLLARLWGLPLAAHVGVLALALLLLIPLAQPTVSTSDEGAYGIQAELVASGRWDYRPALERLDPDGRYFPISRSEAVDGRWYPYVKHPLVPVTMAPLVSAFGRDVGVLALPLLGTLMAALAAWLLAAELDPRRSRLAFWLAAASPLLVNGYVVWAHTIAAALAGAAGIAGMRILRRGPTAASVVGLSAALVGGVLLRSESVLFAGALLAALFLVLVRRKGLVAAVVSTGVPGACVAVALLAERSWVAAIVHGSAPRDLVLRRGPDGPDDLREPSYIVGRLQGVWHSTVSGSSTGSLAVRLLLPVALVVVVAVVIRWRRDAGAAPEAAVLGLVALMTLAMVAHPAALVPGFLPAAPVLVLGVVAAVVDGEVRRGWLLLLAAGFYTAFLFATQYSDGGNFQWGGRFLSPLVVPFAALAALGLASLVERRPAARRRSLAATLAVLALVSSVGGVAALGSGRQQVDRLYGEIVDASSPVNVTTSDLLPRLMWREDLPWLRARPVQLDALLDHLRAEGVTKVTVVAAPEDAAEAAARWADADDLGAVGATPLHIIVVRQ